ncbi:RdgB/HAM1 family non-canonical purine NTP pyrophosphatase [bacterium]|nr:RdgB/HAM1 family non-canonical purine NTP pyrophosphatase [bacterium]
MPDKELLIASHNRGKILEIAHILTGLPVRVVQARELGQEAPEFPETGVTFRENTLAKATAWSTFSGLACLADDSGLCVSALEGAPGIYSARYAGEPSDDRRNNGKLLAALRDVPDGSRQARFVCCLALVVPGVPPRTFEAEVWGTILHEPVGEGGFGYDPLFFYPPLGLSFAQLGPERKNRISHRALALGKLRAWIETHPELC